METRIELRQAVLGPPSLMSIPFVPRRFCWIEDELCAEDIGKDEGRWEGAAPRAEGAMKTRGR